MNVLRIARVRKLLQSGRQRRILVVGDLMLDQFIWGAVRRISPEAPVPVVEVSRESFMPGGGANVARNLSALGCHVEVFGVVGDDPHGRQLRELLRERRVNCAGITVDRARMTGLKTRIIAHQQQVVRVDRETTEEIGERTTTRLLTAIRARLPEADAVIVGDYGKGVVTQRLVDELREHCRKRAVWLSCDPKPVHRLHLEGFSLITPNRKEAFQLAGAEDAVRPTDKVPDAALSRVAETLLAQLNPAVLLITLGDQGMLLCRHKEIPFHIPTVAREVFDVSGAGDTVMATFTLSIVAGASPVEAAILSNHAAGLVVGKVGTATVTPEELVRSFQA